jgi:hypothetical protein
VNQTSDGERKAKVAWANIICVPGIDLPDSQKANAGPCQRVPGAHDLKVHSIESMGVRYTRHRRLS